MDVLARERAPGGPGHGEHAGAATGEHVGPRVRCVGAVRRAPPDLWPRGHAGADLPPVTRATLNPDFSDLLAAFRDAGVEFVVVGAHALAVHGVARATGDLDVFVRPGLSNARRVHQAL